MKNILFASLCKAHGLPIPQAEVRFAPPRKWRFDWAWIEERGRVALEIQGGLFVRGRHTRGAALLKEYEKLNAAAVLGYRVLFCTWQQIEDGSIFPIIKACIDTTR